MQYYVGYKESTLYSHRLAKVISREWLISSGSGEPKGVYNKGTFTAIYIYSFSHKSIRLASFREIFDIFNNLKLIMLVKKG